MTLPNVETYFSEIFCCAEAKLFNSKPPEAKFKLSCKYIHTRSKGGGRYVYSLKLYPEALLQETSKIWEDISNFFKSH